MKTNKTPNTLNTTKYYNPKSTLPGACIPLWLLQVPRKELSFGAKMLYGRLIQWTNEKGKVYRYAPQLSQEIGTTVRNIERYLKELRDVELIGTYQTTAGGVNNFEFYDHEWMHIGIVE
jgi:hypothetical protein